ncbi:MAG: putative metal-binding motif-containing protein [Myxococcota bacterium]
MLTSILILLSADAALANSGGRTGRSTSGCRSCHGSSAASSTSVSFSVDDTTVEPGDTITVSFTVSTTSSSHTGAGMNVSASDGTLSAGTDTKTSSSELTHSGVAEMSSSGSHTFTFEWTAPLTEGTVTLSGAGNAVNENGSSSGDGWNLDTLTLNVDDGCDDDDGDGFETCDGDCDDTDDEIYPGADELCNDVDDDCNDEIDDDPTDALTYYRDDDEDGYGDPEISVRSCDAVSGHVRNDEDCDDTDEDVSPDGEEVCNDIDDDCNDEIDEAAATDASTWYRDRDEDGYGDPEDSRKACTAPDGYIADDADCDDTDEDISPDGEEVCNDADDDCNGETDEASASDAATWYRDRDSDGFGDVTESTVACDAPEGYVSDATDCDDTRGFTYPGAEEVCDARDNDCDDVEDEGLEDESIWHLDSDGDGFGDAGEQLVTCDPPEDYVINAEDCDDGDDAVYPGADELCNDIDDNCDETVDEDTAVDARTWHRDRDEDGFGDAADAAISCEAPDGYVLDNQDCRDDDDTIFPGADEVAYDDIDQDCDGEDLCDVDGDGIDGLSCDGGEDCDDEDDAIFPGALERWYDGVDQDCLGDDDFDADTDGFQSETYGGTDCDDADDAVYPGADDANYDGVINDCDASDEFDADADGFDSDQYDGDDCDDANSAIFPGAAEIWYDGVDSDCDGADDFDADGDGVPQAEDCDDTDADRSAQEDCAPPDTEDPDAEDPDAEDPEADAPSGCATAPMGAGWALILGVFGAVWRRRRA